MTNTQVFNVNKNGSYPSESYVISPISLNSGSLPQDFTSTNWNYLDGSGSPIQNGSLITRSYLSYHKNPLNKVLDYKNTNYPISLSNDINLVRNSSKFATSLDTLSETVTSLFLERVDVMTLTNTSAITFNVNSLRSTLKTPYEFFFFYLQLNDKTKNSYGVLVYPNRIFLKPVSLTNNNNKWQLTLQPVLLQNSNVYIGSDNIEYDAYATHLSRLDTLPSVVNLPNSNSYNLYFGLCACRTRVDYNVLEFNGSVPSSYGKLLDSSDVGNINPDSTFISYNFGFTDSLDGTYKIQQLPRDISFFSKSQNFNPTYIVNYDPTVNNIQTFQFLQAPLNDTYLLSDSRNSVLSSNINLSDGYFNFFNYYTQAQITAPDKSYIGVDYIADCYNLQNPNINALTTLTNGQISVVGGSDYNVSGAFPAGTFYNKNFVFETQYPPYCYSYKIKLTDDSNNYLDSNTLNFYLKISALNSNPTNNTVSLSSFITTDFNALNIPLPTTDTDKISYSVVATNGISLSEFLNNVECTYGNSSTQASYDISTSPSVPTALGQNLTISYIGKNFSGVTFSVKGTIFNASGQMDSFHTEEVTLGAPNNNKGNNIFLNVLQQQSNSINVDSSFNIKASAWPSRDLRDSEILWSYDRTDLPLAFSYVDQNGNYINPVNGSTTFGPSTWTVNLSGYGPETVVIKLSSKKYNEVATITSNPVFYNFLNSSSLSVGVLSPLNNLDLTRTITLTAAVPYGRKLFTIPSNIPINWTWEYDGKTNPFSQPITVKQILNNNSFYRYGTDTKSRYASAVQFNITPGYSKVPNIHKVRAIATINVVNPPVSAYYDFNVDDFPDSSIFNCDFEGFYTQYLYNSSYKISDTRNQKNTITRPNDYLLNFTFSAKKDVLSKIINPKLYWSFNSLMNSNTSDTYNVDLTNSLSGFSPKTLNNLSVTSLNIGLNLLSAYAPGWTSAHNVSATTNIYILSSFDFYKELQFITYPEYAWIGEKVTLSNGTTALSSTNVTYLSNVSGTPSYYTNAFMPSAYLNTRSSTQNFWFSANKNCFGEFIYQNRDDYTIMSTNTSYDLLPLKYNKNSISYVQGIPITLLAFNDSFYPENIDLTFQKLLSSDTGVPTLTTDYYRITAATIKGRFPSKTNVESNFFLSPVFLNYDDVQVRYLTFCDGVSTTLLNLDSGGNISVLQYIDTLTPYLPSKIIGGSLTYYLSSKYWSVSTTIPFDSLTFGTSALYKLFNVGFGDPSVPLYSGNLGGNIFELSVETNLIQQIPPSTFDSYYGTSQYPSDPDLWTPINIS